EREPGAAGLPRFEVAGRVAPPRRAAGSHVGLRGVWPPPEQLGEEVAPAELTHERVGTVALPKSLGDIGCRQAAEVKIWREARGAVDARQVSLLVVPSKRAPRPSRDSRQARAFAALPLRRRTGARDRPDVDAGRHREPPRSGRVVAPRRVEPSTRILR